MSGDPRKRKRIERKLFGTPEKDAEKQGAAGPRRNFFVRGNALRRYGSRGTRLDPQETLRLVQEYELVPDTQPEKDESLLFINEMVQHFNDKESFVERDSSGKSIAYMFLGDLDSTDGMRDIIFDIKLCLERINPTLFNEESSSESKEALKAYYNFLHIFVPVNAIAGNLVPGKVDRTFGLKVKKTPEHATTLKNPNRVENNPEAGLPEEFRELDLSGDDSDEDILMPDVPKVSRTGGTERRKLRF